MKKLVSSLLVILLLLSLSSAALAQHVTVNGTVVSTQTEIVSAAVGGTVQEINVLAGDEVRAGDVLATLKTTKVYALQDGVVRLFGEVGDDAAAVAEQYGAVAYVEPAQRYTVTSSTKNAFDVEVNRIIHPGETVYLRAQENSQHTGKGQVTAVTDSSYTVEILSGSLESGDSVLIYRDAAFQSTSRIGRDTVTLKAPVAYTGEGLIAAFSVENGAKVKKGDVLFELVEGAYIPGNDQLTQIVAPNDGIVSSVSLTKGGAVSVGGAVAEIYLNAGMRVEASVAESDLQYFQAGNAVRIEFNYLEDGEFSIPGTIEKISLIGAESGAEDSEEAWFSVLIRPESTEKLAYGMHAVITTVEAEAQAETPLPVQTEEIVEGEE